MIQEQCRALLDNAEEKDLKIADVWHEGTKSFYQAILVRPLTPEQALAHPADSIQERITQ